MSIILFALAATALMFAVVGAIAMMLGWDKKISKMRTESRRSQLDHERYMRNREERLQKQRDYYRDNTELCKASAMRCKKKRVERERLLLFN